MNGMQCTSKRELVELTLTGDRRAFEEIVRQNIAPVSAVAYAITGDVATSEDVTQEVFLQAWRRLKDLRDPEKLQSWLCMIARNIAKSFGRKSGGDLIHQAEQLQPEAPVPSTLPSPAEAAIQAEQYRIVWSAIEQIPETYRLPMVLFYRQGQSVTEVAEALDLSEEAVRQKLSRARSMLKDEVARMVEGSISAVRPSSTLVTVIMAGLAGGALQTAAAATTATAISKGAATTGAISGAVAGTFLGPVIGILAGLVGGIIGMRSSLRLAKTPEERTIVQTMIRNSLVQSTLLAVSLLLVVFAGLQRWLTVQQAIIAGGCAVTLCLVLMASTTIRHSRRLAEVAGQRGRCLHVTPLQRQLSFVQDIRTKGPSFTLIGYGGAVFGSLSLLLVEAALLKQPSLFWSVLASGTAIVVAAIISSSRKPTHYMLHMAMSVLGVIAIYWAVALYWWSAGTRPVASHPAGRIMSDLSLSPFLPALFSLFVLPFVMVMLSKHRHFQKDLEAGAGESRGHSCEA